MVRKNATSLRQVNTNAQKALDTIPGVPARALSALDQKYNEVKGRGENIFSSLMAEFNALKLKAHTPAIDDAAIEAHVLSFLDGFFKAKAATRRLCCGDQRRSDGHSGQRRPGNCCPRSGPTFHDQAPLRPAPGDPGASDDWGVT